MRIIGVKNRSEPNAKGEKEERALTDRLKITTELVSTEDGVTVPNS